MASAKKSLADREKTRPPRQAGKLPPNHREPAAKPVSLAPLSFEKAIKGLVAVSPEKSAERPRG